MIEMCYLIPELIIYQFFKSIEMKFLKKKDNVKNFQG